MPQHTPVPSLAPEVALAQHLRAHLKTFLAPLLQRLSRQVDVRLVQTVSLVVEALIRLRQRPQALWLTDIGTLLLGAAHAPAGVKRIARLLASPHWRAAAVEQWLLEQADQVVVQEPDVALVALDQRVLEKPESQAALGVCPVRSSKARRLARPRPGFGAGPPRPPVTVPGFRLSGGDRDGLERSGALGGLPQLRVRALPVLSPKDSVRVKQPSCGSWWPVGDAGCCLSGIGALQVAPFWRSPERRGHALSSAGPSAITWLRRTGSRRTPGA